jgi:hypothetical protein
LEFYCFTDGFYRCTDTTGLAEMLNRSLSPAKGKVVGIGEKPGEEEPEERARERRGFSELLDWHNTRKMFVKDVRCGSLALMEWCSPTNVGTLRVNIAVGTLRTFCVNIT